jgi:RHS repeat-associated protein
MQRRFTAAAKIWRAALTFAWLWVVLAGSAAQAQTQPPVYYPNTSMTECPAGQALKYFYFWQDWPTHRGPSWCSAPQLHLDYLNAGGEDVTWRIPYRMTSCVAGQYWTYTHMFRDASGNVTGMHYSPPHAGVNMVCQPGNVLISMQAQSSVETRSTGTVTITVKEGGVASAGRQVSVSLQGTPTGSLSGCDTVTNAQGEVNCVYHAPDKPTINVLEASCTGCENSAKATVSVFAQPLTGQSCSAKQAGSSTPKPIYPATGEKITRQVDFVGEGPHPLQFERVYRSAWVTGGVRPGSDVAVLGRAWTHNHNVQLLRESNNARIVMPDGSTILFQLAGGVWTALNSNHTLQPAANNGWEYRDADGDTVWLFDSNGRLTRKTERNGWQTNYTYGQRLAQVTNHFGQSIQFTYNYAEQVASITVPGGQVITFQYDAQDRLARVTYPGSQQRQYHYENTSFPLALTGITDEGGQRYATYTYDAQGRATNSQLAAGADSYSVSYAGNGQATITDPLGTQRTYSYAATQGILTVTGASSPSPTGAGDAASRVQNSAGLIDSETDYLGVQTMYTWDINRRLPTATTYAANRPEAKTVQTQWHSTFRLPTLVTEAGRTTAYTYDADGNKLTQTVTDTATNQARTWTWTYNAQKLPATMTDPKNGTWTYAYDTAGNLTSETNPLGHVTSYTHDAAGRVLTQTEPTGLVTTYTYDARGRVLTVSRSGETTTFTYQPTGNLATATFASGLAITYTYDAAQRMTGWSTNRGAQGVYTLDAAGNRTVEQVKDTNGNVIWQLARSINSLNRVQSETLGVNQSTTYAYNANGDATGETNGLNQATSLTLDGLKRVTAITNAANATASLAYDARDSVTTATDFKGAATTYTRNAFGEAQQEASGDAGTRTTSYDALGLPSQITDALGQATSIQRDALGRPTQMSFQDGKTTILRYDLTGSDYNAPGAPNASKGYLSEVEDRAGITKWQRDIQGRVTQRTQTLKNGSTQTVSYTYNAQGLLDTLTYPGGGQLQHSYDATGRLSGMSWNGSALIANITWNALNQPTGWSWAFTTPVNATRSYDTAGRTTATEITSYSYDAAGRITSLTQNLGQPADSDPNSTSVTFANTTFTVGYDATGKITSFGDGTTTTSFTYDANGNRQSSTTTAGATTTSRTYTVEATSNRLTGFTQDITGPGGNSSTAVSYTYNANGDITADGLRNFSFDAEGRLSSVATGSTQTSPTTRYAHSALGERLFKTEPLQIGEEPEPGQEQNFIEQLFTFFKKLWAPQTTTAEQLGWAYAYDEEGTLLSEIGMGGANSTGQTNYIWLPTPNGPMPVAAIVNGNKYAVHADHLNTPRRLTNQYGEAAWQWKFSAFGDEAPTRAAKRFVDPDKTSGMGTGTVADITYNLRYPGQTADQESGLYYNYFRSYNSNIGRYPQTDPIGLDGGWNRFSYVGADAVNRADPRGLAAAGEAVGGTVGAWGGRALGSTVGALIPLPGAAAVGGLVGGYAGKRLGSAAGSFIEDACKSCETQTYHRLASETQTAEDVEKQVSSGMICGAGRRQAGGGVSPIPSVKAYPGPLPPGQKGVEFQTKICPSSASPSVVYWHLGSPGVVPVGELACIPVKITKVVK